MDDKSLVVKENSLIHASYALSLVEQRLLLLAIIVIREHTHNNELDYIAFNKPIRIHAEDYVKQFNVDRQTAYKNLREASKSLFARQFSYQEKRGKNTANVTSRWVSDIAYIDNEAIIEVTFTRSVIPLITELENNLTSYEIGQVKHLTSSYALRLYELLVAWKNKGISPKWQIDEFRRKIGVEENTYSRMGQFKEKVLDFAVEQINSNTEMTVKYKQFKKGRKIDSFQFTIKMKSKPKEKDITPRDPNTGDMFTIDGLTDKQLARIARSEQFKADYNHLISPTSPINNDYTGQAWVNHFVNELKKDASRFNKRPLRDYLDY